MYTLQIQTVLYGNDKQAVLNALDALANAVRNDFTSDSRHLESVVVVYGDASQFPLFTEEEISILNGQFQNYLKLEYVFFNENTGTAKGHNKLAQNCPADYMMIMNPDVIVSPFFFEAMFQSFEDRKDVGLVEARQTPIEHPKYYHPNTGETSWASTAAVILPTAIFNELGGFDQDTFFMYCDDVDFSWRIRLAEKKIIYQPDAQVYHAKSLSNDALWKPTEAEVYYSAEAALLMAYKWSNSSLQKKLLQEYLQSEAEVYIKAAKSFLHKEKEGALPRPLDPNHKVAEFINGAYTTHRFFM